MNTDSKKKFGAQIADGQGNPAIIEGSLGITVVKSDTVDFIQSGLLFVGVGGAGTIVKVLLADEPDDTNSLTFKNIPSGTFTKLRVRRVLTTTSASDMILMF